MARMLKGASVDYLEIMMFVPLDEDSGAPAFYVGVKGNDYYAEQVARDGSSLQTMKYKSFPDAVIRCGEWMKQSDYDYTLFKG